MGGRGEGWVYSVDSVLDYGMGRRLGKERNEPIEITEPGTNEPKISVTIFDRGLII